MAGLATARALARSIGIYYGDRERSRAMDALHRRFVKRGDVVFDVGAHVGDRTASFRRLGAKVVSVEPQPALARMLRLAYGWRGVAVVQAAVGRAEGRVDLRLNIENPTVATASEAFIAAARDAEGWERQRWTQVASVPMTTLDALAARHGVPDFLKIDVEGFEAEALAGMRFAPPALSFEFTTIQRDVAHACVARMMALGDYRFNAALGETQILVFAEPLDAAGIGAFIDGLPAAANSGDIYAIAA